MKSVKISATKTHIKGQINLPASKSISNRALLLQAINQQLHQSSCSITNLSTADDTQILAKALKVKEGKVDIKNAGTCARFLCAYYAATPGVNIELFGEPRMAQRPIKNLVEALRTLGADIVYLETEGQFPLQIKGKQLNGGQVEISAEASSQFVSALMLISPLLSGGLNLSLSENIVSKRYIEMTAALMKDFGYAPELDLSSHQIKLSQTYLPNNLETFEVEADWSSAAFFYEAALLSEEAELTLTGLRLPSIQGDAIVANWFEELGVKSQLVQTGIKIHKTDKVPGNVLTFDCTDYPDLSIALVCATAGAGIAIRVNGLSSLVHKESNRLDALLKLLQKLHIKSESDNQSYLAHDGLQRQFYHGEILSTEKDHRLAMAFGMLAQYFSLVRISEINSVVKSFPQFWLEAEKIGLECE